MSGKVGVSKSPRRTNGSVAQRLSIKCNELEGRKFESCPSRKLYVIGRADIPPGLRAAQMFHAARVFLEAFPETEKRWFKESNTIVLLEVADRVHLEGILDRAEREGLEASGFTEEDYLELGVTAACLGPKAQKLLSSIPLAFRDA